LGRKGGIIPTGNGANFRLVSRHERVWRIFLNGGKANERFLSVCALRQYARRLQVNIVKAAHICCATGFRKGALRGLSRMMGCDVISFK
jgi:hypothetical protein